MKFKTLSKIFSRYNRPFATEAGFMFIVDRPRTEYLLTLYGPNQYLLRWTFLDIAFNEPKEQRKILDGWKAVEDFLAGLPPLLTVKRYYEGEVTRVYEDVVNDYAISRIVKRIADKYGCVDYSYWYCAELGNFGDDKIIFLSHSDLMLILWVSRLHDGADVTVSVDVYRLWRTYEF